MFTRLPDPVVNEEDEEEETKKKKTMGERGGAKGEDERFRVIR